MLSGARSQAGAAPALLPAPIRPSAWKTAFLEVRMAAPNKMCHPADAFPLRWIYGAPVTRRVGKAGSRPDLAPREEGETHDCTQDVRDHDDRRCGALGMRGA